MARPAGFDLAAELARPSFTPARSDAPALADLVADGPEATAAKAMPALAGLGAAGRDAILARLAGAIPDDAGATSAPAPAAPRGPAKPDLAIARLVQALGLVARAGDAPARATLLELTRDPRVRVRRAAIVALGKLAATAAELELRASERRGTDRRQTAGEVLVELRDGETRRETQRRGLDDVRAALLDRWDAGDHAPEERRALAEALGKIGGDEARARLAAIDPAGDKELARLRDRALLMVERTAKRGEDSTIATDVAPPRPLRVRLSCRPELGALLDAELTSLGLGAPGVRVRRGSDWVDVTLAQPWQVLFRARLWDRAAIGWPLDGAAPLPDAIVAALTSPEVLGLVRAWTRGPIRWRLGMVGGHQRALVWKVAKRVTEAAPDLINDPSATTWDVLVDGDARMLSLVPRRIDDPRFAYRVAEVPAASHGSVAAALVWAAEPKDGDRVWDPFCGSGVELVERAKRGPTRSLLGTDVDPAALEAARQNLASAGVAAELALGDARTHQAGAVDLIVTNPPLGSRVHVDAGALLAVALPNLARALAPGGRLVWITPAPRKTTPAAQALGLTLASSTFVDLGGVRGRLERWNR